MKMDFAKKIIHLFLHHPMPEKARALFRQWCLDPSEARLKEQLLEEEWNRLDPRSVIDIDRRSYERKLRRLHADMGLEPRRPSLRSLILRVRPAAAAVILLGLVTVNILIVNRQVARRSTTTYVTADNSKGRFTLPDQTVVWLNAGSQLSISENFNRDNRRYVRLNGEAFFEVRKDSLRPFVVELGQMQVKVLGTRFNACNFEAFATNEVTLLSGSVEILSDRLKKPLRLAPNESCVFNTQSQQFIIKQVTASNYCNWRNDSIVFENTPLADILTNLEHRYNVRFQVDPGVDTTIGLSFTLQPENLENTLDLTATLANLHYTRIDEHFIRIYR